ncbi:hypothetical protein SK128_013628 [Halocaridina rubra]|uniref:Uncharacterized protein n=1 Tax=Halocaridina rubra TaxID=373956 RepID=A0AAN9A3F1_HALRR
MLSGAKGMGFQKGRFGEFMHRNMVVIVMIPVIIGFHWGWQRLQYNEAFVPKGQKRDLPVVEGARYIEDEIKRKLGLGKE